jgi:hypothetical protein
MLLAVQVMPNCSATQAQFREFIRWKGVIKHVDDATTVSK